MFFLSLLVAEGCAPRERISDGKKPPDNLRRFRRVARLWHSWQVNVWFRRSNSLGRRLGLGKSSKYLGRFATLFPSPLGSFQGLPGPGGESGASTFATICRQISR